MRETAATDKDLIIDLLTSSFQDNQSVNYLIPPDEGRIDRIRSLMDYSFETCRLFGKVYISDDRKACALVSFPEKKKATLKSLWLEARLIFTAIGFGNIGKAISREREIAKHYPASNFLYLWFIGVHPESQHKGVGRKLMLELLAESERMNRPIYLETSTLKNVPWYEKFGLTVYNRLDFGYNLFLMRSTTKDGPP